MTRHNRSWLKFFSFLMVTVALWSVCDEVPADRNLSGVCSGDLKGVLNAKTVAFSYNSASHKITHLGPTATTRRLKWNSGAHKFRASSLTPKGTAATGIGRAMKRSVPSGWQMSNQVAFNTWLYYHPSPNSACQDDMYATLGANSSNEISCDWRLQLKA